MARALSPHRPVLVDETLDALAIQADGRYVDATFGRGGHTAAILARLGPAGSVLALDRDPAAERWASAEFGTDARFQFVRTRFGRLAPIIAERGLLGRIHGVLLDLGVSSPQVDDPERGFSSVSYTHLDVYKRQASTCRWAMRSSTAPLPRRRMPRSSRCSAISSRA